MTTNESIKLFWPSHLCSPKSKAGYIIGWYNTLSTICVAAIMPGMELKEAQALLKEFCVSDETSEFTHINKVCKVPPQLLGAFVDVDNHTLPSATERGDSLWLTVGLDQAYVPVPLSIYHGQRHIHYDAFEIIFYEQPNPKQLQFLALNPIELDISTKDMSDSVDAKKVTKQSDIVIQKNKTTIIDYSYQLNQEIQSDSDDLGTVLVQINSSYYLENGMKLLSQKHLMNSLRYSTLLRITAFLHAISDYAVKIVTLSPKGFVGHYIRKMMLAISLAFLFLALALSEVTLHLLSVRLPKFILNGVALKDLFAAGQQIDLRLQQLFFWPRQYMMIRKRNWKNTARTRAYYISFYNSMWLVANDIIIGLAIGSFLMNNNVAMAKMLHKILHKYTVESLQSMMLWFLESPAGLKLNHELASFLSELFLWLIRLWTVCTQVVEPYTPQIIHIIGLSGVFGVTMVISLLSDFLAFLTLHVYCFYMVAARIFNWQLVILYSLFNLFRGKKRNILRNRIDSCDYDLDQLLLGTSLFTLLTFLFPTIVIYYVTFAVGRVGVIFLQAIMETILAFFNHFPLFAIMLRLKDPDRLPGGLQFERFQHESFLLEFHGIYHRLKQAWLKLKTKPHTKHTSKKHHRKMAKKRTMISFNVPDDNVSRKKKKHTVKNNRMDATRGSYLWMRNMPIPLGAIFFQYMLLWKRLSAHYFSAYVFKCLLYGEPIKPIPKLQYPMLPDKRPSLSALWQTLKSTMSSSKTKTS